MTKMLFLVNPISGVKTIGNQMIPILNIYTKNGYDVTVHISQSSEDVEDIFLNHSSEYDIMVCSGGDGTLNRSVDALIRSNNHPFFSYLPAGTVNDFATTHHIPKNVVDAAELTMSGKPIPCDIGLFENNSFTYVSAFGTFADVSYSTSQKLKNIFGKMAYTLEGAKRFFKMKCYHAVIECDDNAIEGDFLAGIFSSSISVGGYSLPILADSKTNDGLMECLLVKKPKSIFQAVGIIRSLFSKNYRNSLVTLQKTKKVIVNSETEIPYTVDGEYAGRYCKAHISMRHEMIQIIQ